MLLRRIMGVAAFLGVLNVASVGQAQSVNVQDLIRRLDAAEAKIRTLESDKKEEGSDQILRRIDALENVADVKKDGKKEEIKWVKADNKLSIKVGGRLHLDYGNVLSQDAANVAAVGDSPDFFEVRRARIGVSGEGYGVFIYKIEFDFADTDPVMTDVYGGIQHLPGIGKVQIGHFKAPMSLEELTSSRFISFMERSLPNALVPSREVGIAMFNHTESEAIGWSAGIFFDDVSPATKELQGYDTDGDGAIDDFDLKGFLLINRIHASPLYESDGRYMVHVGASGSYTDDGDDVLRVRTRPEYHLGPRFIDTGNQAVDSYTRLAAEFAAVWGPASIQTEVISLSANGANGAADFDLWGAYVYGSYFLTGEHRPYSRTSGTFDRVKPLENFWIVKTDDCNRCAGWGAWEVLARWSYLDLNDPALAGQGSAGTLHDVTLGVNWYWNPQFKMMFNVIRAMGDRNDVGANDADMFSVSTRLDF